MAVSVAFAVGVAVAVTVERAVAVEVAVSAINITSYNLLLRDQFFCN